VPWPTNTRSHCDKLIRTDFAAIEDDLQFLASQVARLPTRRDLAKAALGIIISTAALVILWAEAFWHLSREPGRSSSRLLLQ
jgi:hypothetical protein